MNATLNAEDNEMIPRILTGDLRKPQLEWLMLRKILQVQESLKVQWEECWRWTFCFKEANKRINKTRSQFQNRENKQTKKHKI